MNIKYLHELLSRINEIKIIGKNTEINGIVCNVAGVVRYDTQLRLIILSYDEQFREQIEGREIAEFCNDEYVPETNRIIMKGKDRVSHPLIHITNVSIGDVKFEVSGSENQRLNDKDGESVLFLSELLRNGWNPEGVDYQNIEMLFLTSIELIGNFAEIPDFGDNPLLHFIMGKNSVSYLVEKPIMLTVNGEYSEKIWFKNEVNNEEHWIQINKVYLNDMWSEMEKTFSNPKILNQMTKEEIAESRINFEKSFIEVCPKGMCYAIIEYECEECISVQFYTKKHLESKPANRNYAMGFIGGADKPTGILGKKLKAAIIQEPVLADTVSIEAELFNYYKNTILDDIIL